jgi:membrane protease YdiL (CAAX protease family)
MQSSKYKLSELFILFIVFPIAIAIDFPIWIKFIIGILGFIYVIYVLLKIEKNKFKLSSTINWRRFWKATSLKLLFIAFITLLYVWFTDESHLFIVIRTKPLLWVIILFVYSFLSVYPQELLYRTFFFQRYQYLVNNEKLFIFINAIIFSLGHLFFKNTLVIVLTFLGGLLFAFTYHKTKSTLLVSIEHAIYGCWLFTIGMGSMLGFPS